MTKAKSQTVEKAPSRVQQVMREVAAHIRRCGLKVGDTLPSELQLSEELGVSRTAIREAFRALSALGVVDVGNGRRPRVSAVNSFPMEVAIDHALHTGQVSFPQVWEVRRRLECGAAALAAENRSSEQAARILGLAMEMQDCDPQSDEMTRLDIEFHEAISDASGNILFAQIASAFHQMMKQAVPMAWETRNTMKELDEILDRHMEVANAISKRNAKAAETAMGLHFDDTISAMLQSTQILDEPKK